MVSQKGISPLVATVLLIAITMTIAGGLAFFASSIVNSKLSESANQTIATSCQFVRFQVYACSYNSANSQLNVILNNIGTVDYTNATVTIIYPNNTITTYNLNDSVPSGILKSFVISGVSSGYNAVLFKSLSCPDVSVQGSC